MPSIPRPKETVTLGRYAPNSIPQSPAILSSFSSFKFSFAFNEALARSRLSGNDPLYAEGISMSTTSPLSGELDPVAEDFAPRHNGFRRQNMMTVISDRDDQVAGVGSAHLDTSYAPFLSNYIVAQGSREASRHHRSSLSTSPGFSGSVVRTSAVLERNPAAGFSLVTFRLPFLMNTMLPDLSRSLEISTGRRFALSNPTWMIQTVVFDDFAIGSTEIMEPESSGTGANPGHNIRYSGAKPPVQCRPSWPNPREFVTALDVVDSNIVNTIHFSMKYAGHT
ncbi:hypothetical protein C8J56DRAFT_1057706 [Mycena floridula]|nr:hypothetical protein C8J56DRAFT_1057706 [Mycena floridula]